MNKIIITCVVAAGLSLYVLNSLADINIHISNKGSDTATPTWDNVPVGSLSGFGSIPYNTSQTVTVIADPYTGAANGSFNYHFDNANIDCSIHFSQKGTGGGYLTYTEMSTNAPDWSCVVENSQTSLPAVFITYSPPKKT